MADGSIIEFEPLSGTPLAATVLGEKVRTADAGEMQQSGYPLRSPRFG